MGFNLENELPGSARRVSGDAEPPAVWGMAVFWDGGGRGVPGRRMPWEFRFSVENSQEALFQMQEQVERLGFVPNLEHRFLIVAKNRK